MTASDCTFAHVITVSPKDVLTPTTAREILANNRAVEAVCKR
jgi:hypothetical protein